MLLLYYIFHYKIIFIRTIVPEPVCMQAEGFESLRNIFKCIIFDLSFDKVT
jgi:hypothetical protein